MRLPQRNRAHFLLPAETVTGIKGEIISSPAKTQNGKYYACNFYLNAAEAKINGTKVQSRADGLLSVLIPTAIAEVYFPGKLYSAANKKGAFLYESGALYHFSGSIKGSAFIVKSCSECTWKKGLFGKIDFFRALCRLQFKRLMYAWGSAGGLLLALLCGSREYLDPTVYSSFRTAGLSHIIALSGMHLSMFSSIALFFGSRFGRKKLTFIIRIIALILFVWFFAVTFKGFYLQYAAFICRRCRGKKSRYAFDFMFFLSFTMHNFAFRFTECRIYAFLRCAFRHFDYKQIPYKNYYESLSAVFFYVN